jgi:hypothetical protein
MAMSVLLQDVFHYYKKYDEFSKCVSISVLKPQTCCMIFVIFSHCLKAMHLITLNSLLIILSSKCPKIDNFVALESK